MDDRRDIRYIAQHLIEKAGGRVISATNGQEAIDILTTSVGDVVDVVVMDMQMPTMDGYRATAILRQQGFRKPIIALTANAMKEDRDKCMAAGCTDYTSKPLNGSLLIEVISKALQRTTDLLQLDVE